MILSELKKEVDEALIKYGDQPVMAECHEMAEEWVDVDASSGVVLEGKRIFFLTLK